MAGRRAPRAAFTLVELLLVLAIMGALAGGLIVSLHGRRGAQEMKLAAHDLAAAVRFAEQEAHLTGRSHRVAFDAARRAYRVESASAGDPAEYGPVNGVAGSWRRLPPSITADELARDGAAPAADPVFAFTADGTGFVGTIQLRARESAARIEIEVASETGQVRLIER